LAEHSGRYTNLVNYLVPGGYAVFAFDLPGHGKSEGARGYVERFQDYLDDLHAFLTRVRAEHATPGTVIIGHSMGGTIAAAYAASHQETLVGLVLSGPVLLVDPSFSPALVAVTRILSAALPKAGIMTLDATAISRDSAVVDAYVADPLVYRGKISARLGIELMKAIQRLPGAVPTIKLPTLILHGTADRLAPPAGSRMLYERISSTDKTLKFYEGCYHELFNELEHEDVLADLEHWLAGHT
jgi:alpha-beta hydrolase superfamily lysophospholipase